MDLFYEICKFTNLNEGQNILEVGAGTGQATDLFVSKSYNLDLLEVSKNQVDFLKNKYRTNKNIAVTESYFEEYKTDKEYDLIYSATAFHWVNSEIGYPKA
ncbi:class I SAM-dependent methyltransferase [Anaerosporobacter sp.]